MIKTSGKFDPRGIFWKHRAGWNISHEPYLIYWRISSRNCKKHGKTRSVGRQCLCCIFIFLSPSTYISIPFLWNKSHDASMGLVHWYIYLHSPLTSTKCTWIYQSHGASGNDSLSWKIPITFPQLMIEGYRPQMWGGIKAARWSWSFSDICLL